MDYTQLDIHPYEWKEHDNGDKTEILAWCLDNDSCTNLIRLTYPYTCYIEIPRYDYGRQCEIEWDPSRIEDLYQTILKIVGKESITKYEIHQKKKIYFYQRHSTSLFIELFFNERSQMEKLVNILKKPLKFHQQSLKLLTWENKIPNVRKLLTKQQCQFSSWSTIHVVKVPDEYKISNLDKEYYGDWESLHTIPPDDAVRKRIYPKILSWDIETHSKRQVPWTGYRGERLKKRPFPNATIDEDEVFLLSAIYQQLGKPETKRRFLISTLECNHIQDAEIIYVKNEVELCHQFLSLARRLEVQIFTGYNIHGFDYKYLDQRLKQKRSDWNQCSYFDAFQPKLYSNSWSSSGVGKYNISYLTLPGIISLDLLPLIKRNYKLRRYKLEIVGQKFVGEGKDNIKSEEIFEAFDDLTNYRKLIDVSKQPNLQIEESVIKEIYDGYNRAMDDMTKISMYCLQDSELVLKIFEKIGQWDNLVQMSNVSGVSISDITHRGQNIRGTSLLYNQFHLNDYVMVNRDTDDNGGYHGAYVLPPKPGRWDHVMVFDFSSLYPSIIIALNICPTTLVHPSKYDQIPIDMCNVIEWDEDLKIDNDDYEKDDEIDFDEDDDGENSPKRRMFNGNPKQTHYHYRFVKKEVQYGMLPQILEGLLTARKQTKKKMKTEHDSVIYQILNSQQLALKINANSMYGYMGTNFSGSNSYPCIEAARCITAFGRKMIGGTAQRFVDEFGANVVGGDTDSIFVKLPNVNNYKEAWIRGKEIEEIIKPWFPKPLAMELEKVGRMFIQKKKYYDMWKSSEKTGELIPLDSKDEDPLLTKGSISARGDSCLWHKQLREKVSHALFSFSSRQNVLDLIIEDIMNLVNGRVEVDQLSIIKNMGSNYKLKNYPLKIFGEQLARQGHNITPGDKLEYIIVDNKLNNETLLGYKLRLLDDYILSDDKEPVDIFYYLNNLVSKSIDFLWEIVFSKEVEQLQQHYVNQDHLSALKELSEIPKISEHINKLIEIYKDSPGAILEVLKEVPGIKTNVKKIIQKYTGRNVKKYRVDNHPVKTIAKALINNDLQLCIKNLASDELYNKLYPMMDNN